MGNKKHKQLLYWKLRRILILSLPFIVLILIALDKSSTFSVTAKTELIEFTTIDDNSSKLSLYNVRVFNYDGDNINNDCSGTFKINKGAVTKIIRVGNGNVEIQIQSDSVNTSVGAFYSDEDEFIGDAGHFVEFRIDDIKNRVDKGETIIIPMSGVINLGRAINYETFGSSTAIVREGKVILLGKYFLGVNYFKSASYDLSVGDQFIVEEPDENSKAYGFATINENSAMTVAYKTLGKKGRIITPGPVRKDSGYYLSGSLYSRFENDPLVKAFSLVIISLGAFVTLWPIFKKDFFK